MISHGNIQDKLYSVFENHRAFHVLDPYTTVDQAQKAAEEILGWEAGIDYVTDGMLNSIFNTHMTTCELCKIINES